MLIEEQIRRIKENIARAYQALLNKGATLPDKQNSNNLSTTIESIASGGTQKKYNITLDCILPDPSDGTIYTAESQDLIMNGVNTVYSYALAEKFSGGSVIGTRNMGLSSVLFPDLTHIDYYGMYHFYTFSSDLETASFPKLEEVSTSGLGEGFINNNKLKSISFPKLKTIYGDGLKFVCADCANLESVNLDSLERVDNRALQYAFRSSKLATLSFPALNSESFSSWKNQFDGMLTYVTGCTVHFPYSLKKIMENWTSVVNGFGGTNTTVLFDLNAALLNFEPNIIGTEIYVDREKITGSSCYVGLTGGEYLCYEPLSNTVYYDNYPILNDQQQLYISVDVTQRSRAVSLKTGVSGLNVTFEVNGIKFPAVEIETGKYAINTINTDDDITYYVDGGETYSDATGTLSPAGSDSYNMTITLKAATWTNFVRPNLTEDGVVGGDSFAVESSNLSTSNYAAYNTMNEDPDDYWWYNGSYEDGFITFYNPKMLKLSTLAITFESNSTSYAADTITILGSNDNQNWTELASSPYEKVVTRNISVNSQTPYKYHKIVLPAYSTWVSIVDIAITGLCKS